MNVGEIALVYAYMLATNFLESLLVLCIPIALSLILPSKWFRDSFVAHGASLVMLGLGYLIFLAYQFPTKNSYPGALLKLWSIALALGIILLLDFIAGRTAFIKKAVEFIAEQATIFLFVYMPLSLISLLIVLPRIL